MKVLIMMLLLLKMLREMEVIPILDYDRQCEPGMCEPGMELRGHENVALSSKRCCPSARSTSVKQKDVFV